MNSALRKDLWTLARFIETYCHGEHRAASRDVVQTSVCDIEAVAGHCVCLCSDCAKLLTHAFVKRMHCPMHPKPACKHCPNHCYHPTYRRRIQEVMRYSGRRL